MNASNFIQLNISNEYIRFMINLNLMNTSPNIPEVPPMPEPAEFTPVPAESESPYFPEIVPENDPVPVPFPKETPPGKFLSF